MGDISTTPGNQLGEETSFSKQTGGALYAAEHKDYTLSETSEDDGLEKEALRIAEEDLNHKKQTYKGWMLVWLAFQSTGVIYGDIGTSPLYVYSSTFSNQPTYDDLVGALSIIIWTLILMVTVKYVCIVLSADDNGEGGTFAVYSLLARYAHIAQGEPNIPGTKRLERHHTADMKAMTKGLRTMIENSRIARVVLKILAVSGVAMVMSDGVLTPPQSILGAIQGLRVVQPNISTSTIIGTSCAIIVLLFAVQPFGTSKIATLFAPIVMVWLLFNACCGIYNLVKFDYSVLKAFSPYFAGSFLVRNGTDGWLTLTGLLLSFTGVEALFADLGAFGKRAIQLSWLCLAFPCLLLAYIGQAAYISRDTTATAYTNPFFHTVIPGTFYFSLVIAVLAAIVASQAMITGTFQLLSQIIKMSYFPHIKTVHTSKLFHGQVYMPLANWLLMIGCIIVTAVYHNTTSIGNAYGVCVIFVTFITTCLVSLVAILVWGFNVLIVFFFFLVFGCLDGLYLSAALTKVPNGAWFTLVLATILSCFFVLWRFGKEQQWSAEGKDGLQLSHFLSSTENGDVKFTALYGGGIITKTNGLGIFFDKVGDRLPTVFAQFVMKFSTRYEIVVFLHMRPLSTPSITESERYVIQRTSIPGFYCLTIRHGYMDSIISPDLGGLVITQLARYITRGSSSSTTAAEHSPAVHAELEALSRAASTVVYVMGKQEMKIRTGTNIFRKALLMLFLWIRENSRTKVADMNLQTDSLFEIGFVKEI